MKSKTIEQQPQTANYFLPFAGCLLSAVLYPVFAARCLLSAVF
jgi:hypothetical protein